MENNNNDNGPVLLFDGVCNLCDNSVQFILKHEKNDELRFSAIQSEAGQKLLSDYNIDSEKTDSVIFIHNGQVYAESDAVLHVSSFLKFPFNLGKILLVFPKSWRNFFYKQVAENRYKWFGKKESCMMPTPDVRKRFLE
ncbi:thiol-disulfide oxidoreductase DCC family protein [Fictibacillus nanhaiensis]|uniref:thiol-disulfide oxidoreductase DCC family protein n=1 Tax=Fictibacillus nanhaiensis TaxID=742169 RepID=UPI001C942A0A|nr:thiol-disulfide oxidoreductase DCC family protein [Fictibacillus nanhaiensis]MBY6037266.1 thiol-disulfide oxidoreductase DCC family protein [Fictibacillus nanhaiensis]